jgi:hypothetical protein
MGGSYYTSGSIKGLAQGSAATITIQDSHGPEVEVWVTLGEKWLMAVRNEKKSFSGSATWGNANDFTNATITNATISYMTNTA